ncbi:hypothetical protein DAPPUDRAFT_108918, partial [Daphnia pulex]
FDQSCPEIDQLIHSLPYVSSPETSCITGKNCSSVQCASVAENFKFSVGLAATCDNDPAIEINANIPNSGVVFWRAIFNDQREKAIPGYFFPVSSSQKIKRQGYLKVNLKKSSSSSNSVVLSLILMGCENIPENEKIVGSSCTQKQIINNLQLECGKGKLRQHQNKICSLHRPFECGEKETCSQVGQSDEGECRCITGFTRDDSGICSTVKNPPGLEVSTLSSEPKANETIVSDSTKDPAALAVNIVVPILVVILVAALLYAAFKHGLIHRLLVNCSGRHAETMMIDDDDDSPLS